MCGTAAEVVPVTEIDFRTIGCGGHGPGDARHPEEFLRPGARQARPLGRAGWITSNCLVFSKNGTTTSAENTDKEICFIAFIHVP